LNGSPNFTVTLKAQQAKIDFFVSSSWITHQGSWNIFYFVINGQLILSSIAYEVTVKCLTADFIWVQLAIELNLKGPLSLKLNHPPSTLLKLPWKSTHHWSCWNKEAREKDIRHQVLITDTFGHNGPTAILLKEVWRRVG
jgi:hypothetical protein